MLPVAPSLATVVLGDVVGSTRRWQDTPEVMPDALAGLDAVVDAAARAHAGERPIEQGEGDSFVVVFARVSDALAFALDVQRSEQPLPLRMAVHTGEVERRPDGRVLGPPLNRCARLRALAAGGQILVSAATAELAVDNLPPGVSLRDLGRHRLRDLTAPEHVRQLCHKELPDEFPPLVSLDRLPNNLPVELKSFVGREAEVGELLRRLDGSRLVTLTGAGGAGKTRLAVEAAARSVDRWPGGVWVADLGSTVDPSMVPSAVASAMGVPEQPLQPLVDTIVASVGDATTLVILDNCEHLLDASAAFANDLLRGCVHASVLATSREALGIDGEITYRVPSLQLPADDDDIACESVRLFVDRATAVRPTITLDEMSRAAVVDLCRRLDGLPLAIELAASRCRAMAPMEIAEQLTGHLRILSAGRRAALPRQRTLEASLRWSHELLSGEERKVLRRLSVFAGGFTLAGAERVAAGRDLDEWLIVDLLTGLVDKSLVHVDEADGSSRYRLLETIRVYAAERLAEAGEMERTRDRHLEHMVAVAESTGLHHYGTSTAYGIAERELDNLRAARDWGIETDNGFAVLRLLASTATYWEQWLPQELVRISPDVVAVEGATPADRVRVLFELVWAATFTGDLDRGNELARDALRTANASGDDRLIGIATYAEGLVEIAKGNASALDRFEAAIGLLRGAGDRSFLANALCDSAIGIAAVGRPVEAVARADEGLRVAGTDAASSFFAFAQTGRCLGLPFLGRFDEAVESAQLARSASVRAPLTDSIFDTVEAWALSGAGDHDRAVELARSAVDQARRFSVFMAIAAAGLVAAQVQWRAGLIPDDDLLDEAEQVSLISGLPYGAVEIRCLRATLSREAGDIAGAAVHVGDAVALADSMEFAALYRPLSRLVAAQVALASGDPTKADELAHQALAGHVEMGLRILLPTSLETLAHVACALESHDEAARLLGASRAMRHRMTWCAGRPEEGELATLLERLEEALGAEACAEALGEGERLPEEGIVAYVTRGRGQRKRPSAGWESLTPTEREVVELVLGGLRNKEIGAKLFISPTTVRTHLTHVFAKLGVSGRTELMAAAANRRRNGAG